MEMELMLKKKIETEVEEEGKVCRSKWKVSGRHFRVWLSVVSTGIGKVEGICTYLSLHASFLDKSSRCLPNTCIVSACDGSC